MVGTGYFVSAGARRSGLRRLWVGSAAGLTTLAPGVALADTDASSIETIDVTGQRANESTNLDKLPTSIQNTPETIDLLPKQELYEQGATRLQDALRYAPGVTLNSGEGGAHGDNVNLRGLQSIDTFFIDGIRDPGSYARDSFNTETVEVLEGPSAILFGNGPAGGIVNTVSKQATLAPLRAVTLQFGTNALYRGTADVDQPISDDAAVRINVMGEKSSLAGRDDVYQKRWGIAPTLSLGINEPTRFTLSYFHQEENNLPDYGIPFLEGEPAQVPRSIYYGIENQDTTQTNVDVMTAKLTHDFNQNLSVSDTFRYGNYGFKYLVGAPVFANDFVDYTPAPGQPLSQDVLFRDRPSSEGTQTYLSNHTDLIAKFDTGPVRHIFVAGVEADRQTNDALRYDNDDQGPNGETPTPLLNPDPRPAVPTQSLVADIPNETADTVGVYAIDTVQVTPQWTLNLGLRFDRVDESGDDSVSGLAFQRTDYALSPRAGIVYAPDDTMSFYFSYSTSFDPAISYLTLAPDSNGQPPEKGTTYEVGAQTRWLGGRLGANLSAFRIDVSNALVSDPDDPTVQEIPGDKQRVDGVELSLTGHLTDSWEIYANYTYLSPKVVASADPTEINKVIPNTARNLLNLWTEYYFGDEWEVGTGVNFVGHRYADTANTANVPAYAIWNGEVAYQATDYLKVQIDAYNITDARYYTGSYYTDQTENHVLIGAGRSATLTLTTTF